MSDQDLLSLRKNAFKINTKTDDKNKKFSNSGYENKLSSERSPINEILDDDISPLKLKDSESPSKLRTNNNIDQTFALIKMEYQDQLNRAKDQITQHQLGKVYIQLPDIFASSE